ncbi:MAG: peptidylprolyl isomerase [Acidobacteria bacterium]|nr:peptidylprolyl isomerase [Acidobacteriota bacterium]
MTKNRFLLAATLTLFTVSASAEVVEAIVARVGDRIITRTQYSDRMRAAYIEIDRASATPDEAAARKKRTYDGLLDEMVEELVIKDRADRLNITISEPELKEAVNRLKAQYGISSDDAFEASLKEAGLTKTQMEARLRETLLTNKVFGRELRSRAELTDKELKARYEREKEQYRLPERAEIREIVVTIPEGATGLVAVEKQGMADELGKQARAGSDFAKLASQFSDAATKADGGLLGEVKKGELIAELDKAIFTANTGDVVGPITTQFGYHILKIEKRMDAELPGFEAVKEQLRKDASEETFQRDYKAYVENLRKEAYIVTFPENIPTLNASN